MWIKYVVKNIPTDTNDIPWDGRDVDDPTLLILLVTPWSREALKTLEQQRHLRMAHQAQQAGYPLVVTNSLSELEDHQF